MPSQSKESINQKKDLTHLNIRVSSLFKILYDGACMSVSSTNGKGDFDILPGHTNFISWLGDCHLKINKGTTENPDVLDFPLQSGVITVADNKVVVIIF